MRVARSPKREIERAIDHSGDLHVKFGSDLELSELVDFRGRLSELKMAGTRNQGKRPSCSVFAVIGAMEYMLSSKSGRAEKLSEEYLIWAVLKVIAPNRELNSIEGGEDVGFTLSEVVQAMRAYGVPLREDMPYATTGGLRRDNEPTQDIIERAKARSGVGFFNIPGRSNSIRIENIVHALNENTPVVIGVKWPHYDTISRTALIGAQKAREDYSHAVTLIGYKCPSGKLEEATFIFRNSWGRNWGSGGYGFLKYDYLEKNLLSSLF